MSVYRSLASRLRNWRRDESGNLIITAAILLPVVVGGVGAAITYSNANASRTSLQSALDAAVLSGAIALGNGQDPVTAATNVFNNNVNSHAKQTTNQITASFAVSGEIVTGHASGGAVNPFAGIIGSSTIPLTVNAAATQLAMTICVLGLNNSAKGSFDINGNPQFNAPNCAVQANTTSTTGMTQEGKAKVVAGKFAVSGGHDTSGYVPPPSDNAPSVPDPYASLPFPSYDSCGNGGNGTQIKDDTTLSPGTYCGGVHIYSTAHVTMQPGIYVMNGGPFWVDGSAVVTGDRVMIGFTGKGATLQIWGDCSVTLTSPTSGTYINMQFMQDNSSSDTHSLWASVGGSQGAGKDDGTGSAKLSFDGTAYFPTQNFWMFGNAVINANSPSLAIVADKVWTQGNATVNITNNNTRNLNVSAPKTGFGARLIN